LKLFSFSSDFMNTPSPQHTLTPYALIVAGGSGSRMQKSTPKQFLLIGGKPILLHTLEAFYRNDPATQIILVLPASQAGHWKELRQEYQCRVPHSIVEGGNSRFQSVKNGLMLVPPESVVAIHDGVRPFISPEIISLAYRTAIEKGTAISSVGLKESIRRINSTGSQTEDRSAFRLVQTPQAFLARLIKEAYRQAESPHFTDCASVAEAAGHPVTLIEGSYENIKITTPEDLILAEALLKQKEL
jgi:2-C-methyl-D-erythritol 4-phosphate cytidylyltransferase